MLVIGIDPGATTGMVAFELPKFPLVDGGEWVGSAVVRAPTSLKLSPVERDVAMAERIAAPLHKWWHSTFGCAIVLEEPLEAAEVWRGQRGARPQKRGTAFRVGALYGLALGAVTAFLDDSTRVHSYPPTNHNGRMGWMQGRGRIRKREDTLALMRLAAKALGTDEAALSEHELMALGVALFHADQ